MNSLSKRTQSILNKHHIYDISFFTTLTEGEILRPYPIGIKGLREIVNALSQKGLKVKGDPVFSNKK